MRGSAIRRAHTGLRAARFRKREKVSNPAQVQSAGRQLLITWIRGHPMAFEPDILISTPSGRVMVIEAKVTMNDLAQTEEALKRYMIGMQYPFGLLITPEKGWVYRDLYSVLSPESVKQVGEFDTTQIWR